MPGLARKLLVFAAVDGLVIQPLTGKGQRATKIKYGDAAVAQGPRDLTPDTSRPNSSFEAFGIIGESCLAFWRGQLMVQMKWD